MEPGEIRLTSTEQAGDRIDEDAKGRLAKLAASLPQGQRSLHPAVAFVTGTAMRAFAPQHAKAQRPLCAVVRRFDAMLTQEYPQRRHLALQPSRQASSLVLTRMVAINQGTQPGIPGAPLATCGGRFGL